MSHTLKPWVIFENTGKEFFFYGSSDDGYQYNFVGKTVEKEDAEFIVRAVNSHDELLEAAKNLYDLLNIKANQAKFGGLLVKAQKVIEKAQGK